MKLKTYIVLAIILGYIPFIPALCCASGGIPSFLVLFYSFFILIPYLAKSLFFLMFFAPLSYVLYAIIIWFSNNKKILWGVILIPLLHIGGILGTVFFNGAIRVFPSEVFELTNPLTVTCWVLTFVYVILFIYIFIAFFKRGTGAVRR